MMNLNEMTSKQLKELGKEHNVKNWWNLKKEELIKALFEIEEPTTVVDDPIPDRPDSKKENLKLKELTFEGKTQSLKKWSEEKNIPLTTLYGRVNLFNWSIEDALMIPVGGRRKKAK